MKTIPVVAVVMLALAGCEAIRPVEVKPTAGAPIAKPRVIGVVADTESREPARTQPISLTARGRTTGDGESFAGTDRKAAKMSVASGPETEESLSSLVAWCEQNDDAMRDHEPPISKSPGSRRLPEERRNVQTEAWIHFAQKEGDNDYHIIIGSSSNLRSAVLMNVEVSGLPPEDSNSYSTLKRARDEFEETFAQELRSGGYTQFDPVHVRISGSLFYDVDHAPGAVGPRGHAPDTAWEIHPVTKITLLQN